MKAKKAKVTKAKSKKPNFGTRSEILAAGKKPETAGQLIRARVLEGKMTAEAIAKEVVKRFKGSTAKPSDVYWNRAQLRKAGVALPA